MRLIDADALRASIEKDREESEMPKQWYFGIECAISHIIHAPTVNAVEVVRCKECKYDHKCNHSVQRITSKPDYMSIVYVPIGWCERGEREGE